MNYRMVSRLLGIVLLCMAGLMLLPLICGLFYREDVTAFAISILITAAIGGTLMLFKPRVKEIYARDGYALVGLSWTIMSLLGALPFVLNGDIPNYIDAFFETVSGFTTTGASILNNIEGLSKSGLFWRSFTHFIGGMGVLVFIMAILPIGGEHSMHIMRAEVPGPVVGKLVPRARQTAIILYIIYTGLTLLETVFLMLGGMNFFEALLHAFASAGTGGFSTRNASIAGFNSAYIEMVIGVFLVLFAANFNLYYMVLIGKGKEALKNEELIRYLGLVAASTLAITVGIAKQYGGVGTALRHAFFNVTSLVSTAGFCTVDYGEWPKYTHSIILVLMLVGGCAGSTGGGLKMSRVILLFRTAAADVGKVINPRRVTCVRLDGKKVDQGTTNAVYAHFALYMLLAVLCTVLISVDGYDVETNFSAAISCLSNVGPALGKLTPAGNYSIFSAFSKIVMAIMMLFGRLEIYAMLILFVPSTWKRKA